MKKTSKHGPLTGPLDRWLSMFTLASRIPVRRSFSHDLSRIDFWLPLMGVPVAFMAMGSLAVFAFPLALLAAGIPGEGATGGVYTSVVFTSGVPTWLPGIGALFILCIQYFSFNLFHFDGLLDTADAFLGAGDKDRKLAILKDSRIGVYAFFVGFVYLAIKLAFLAYAASVALDVVGILHGKMVGVAGVQPVAGWVPMAGRVPVFGAGPLQSNLALLVAFFAYPLTGRLSAALVPCVLPSARPGGLGSLASDSRPGRALGGSAVAFLGYLCIGLPLVLFSGVPVGTSVWLAICVYIVLLLSALVALLFVVRVYNKSVGGYTGDALGAAVELGELVHIVIVCLSFFVLVRLA